MLDLEQQIQSRLDQLDNERVNIQNLNQELLLHSSKICSRQQEKEQLRSRIQDLNQKLYVKNQEKKKRQEQEVPTYEFYQRLLGLYILPAGGTCNLLDRTVKILFTNVNPDDWSKEYYITLKIEKTYELMYSPLGEVQQLVDLLNSQQLKFHQFLKQLRQVFQAHL